jgi:transcriptional regulator with XRE-family HTH domain
MDDLGIYGSETYKDIIRLAVQRHLSLFQTKLTYQKIAEDCGIQKTYLSKVKNHSADLSADQFFAVCEYLKLSQDEINFALLVHSFDRSQNKSHKEFLSQSIKAIRREALKFINQSQSDAPKLVLPDELSVHYYLDPIHQLIHMMLTIEKYRVNTDKIANKLNLSADQLMGYLARLEDMGLIYLKGRKFVVKNNNIHLDQDSEIFKYHIKLMDQLSLGKPQWENDDYVTSIVFATSEKVRDQIRKKLLEVLKSAQKSTLKSEATDLFSLRINLIKW